MIGRTLAHYRVTAKLGEGGMGEVYRATDTKLDREVALKVLPAAFLADPERLARFEREAKLLAQLHHPNIASIFGLEESEGVLALAMELVDGPTLAERLEQGSLPIEECLAIAEPIAAALEEAHEKGIVHRDLKPQNIKASLDGRVKVLDFGLAKALGLPDRATESGSAADLAMSPTLTLGGTEMGVILGTAGYMAPEQAKGMVVDKRADIWAFGVVLYEMLAGGRLFAGDSVPDTLADVLRREIDFGVLPAETPPALRKLLRRCLERNPKNRLRDVGEARLLIAELRAGATVEQPAAAAAGVPTPAAPAAPRRLSPALAAAGALAALAALALGYFAGRASGNREPAAPEREQRFVLAAAGRTSEDRQAIAPGGERIAYTAADGLWLRDLAEIEPHRLAGTDGAAWPFWSPDGAELGFVRERALWRLGLEGGTAKRMCELPSGEFEGGSWGEDGHVVFALATGGWTGSLLRCPVAGGKPGTLYDPGTITLRAANPQVLPADAGVLFTLHDANDRGEVRLLVDGTARVLFGQVQQPTGLALGPGRRLYYSLERGVGTDLWSVLLDEELEKPVGEPLLVAEGGDSPSVARDGALLFAAIDRSTWRLAWLDRAGVATPFGEPFPWNAKDQIVQLSPDGRQASLMLMGEEDRVGELWLAELENGARRRQPLDFEPYSAVWSPDGRDLLVTGVDTALLLPVAGTGKPRRLSLDWSLFQPRFAPDGRWVVGYRIDAESGRDLWRISADGSAPHEPLLRAPGQQANPDVSPDGRLLAYQSDESGRAEIYVRPYPAGERKWQVSTAGGTSPVWNRRGGELIWLSGNAIWSAAVAGRGDELSFGVPRVLARGEPLGLELSLGRFFYNRTFDPAPDGSRFLVVQRVGEVRNQLVYVEHLAGGVASRN
jgi:hypothetical protein